MSLVTNLQTAFTRVATEFKTIRTLITGSATGDLSGLTTNDKTSVRAAINEVKGIADAAVAGTAPNASTTVRGIVELATDAETVTGTDVTLAATPSGVKAAINAYVPPAPSAATATAQGIVELATDAEATTGTDTTRAVTPANVAAVFTSRISTSTALGTSNTLVPSQNAVKAYADGLIAANDAMVFKGVIDASANPNYPASNRGDTYRVSVAGKIGGASGPNVEAGDLLIALTDGTASGTQATVGAQWTIVQTNIDGAVVGPASATASNIALFSGTTGKVLTDGGFSIDSDATMAANSNTRVPTQAATRTYVAAAAYTKADIGDPTTDFAAGFVAGLA